MTKPTATVRQATYARDNHTCVAKSSECFGQREWNHREGVGMGGAGSKRAPVTVADGVTTCAAHNARFESDLLELARHNGWKILRYRGGMASAEIPYYDNTDKAWYLPLDLERAEPLVPMLALELIDAAGSFRLTDADFMRDFPHLFPRSSRRETAQ